MKPVSHHVTCETTGKILGYRALVKIDALVWTNSTCNELVPLSQGWKEHTGTEKSYLSSIKTKKRTQGQPMRELYAISNPENGDP